MPIINEEVSPNETSEYGRGNTQYSNQKDYNKKKRRPKSSYQNYDGSPELLKKKKKAKRGSSITYSSIEYNASNNQDEMQAWQQNNPSLYD